MGTITTRQGKSGALRHTAQIRLKRNGRVVHSEARTFGTVTRAKEWLHNREFEIRQQHAPGAASRTRPLAPKGGASSKSPSAQQRQLNPTASRTLFLLLAEFGSGQILLEKYCHYFGMKPEEARRAATRQSLPISVFRLGSQKSPWMMCASMLAQHIDAKCAESEHDWRRINQQRNNRLGIA